ncbi:MAG: helix-turn-helix transcriptional regulator [Clostridia bacterium]|nr:helix-turn-helix transcriptional regulator [Clostridia bacterium]
MHFNESCYHKYLLAHPASEIAKKLYYYVQWTGHFVCKSDFYIKRTNFKSYLLLYTVKGNAIFNYMGKSYDISPKSVMFLDCEKPHEYYPVSDCWEFKFIHFTGNESYKYYDYITNLYDSYVIYNVNDYERYFDTVYENVKISKGEECDSDVIYHILTRLISDYNKTTDIFKISDVLRYISENYSSDISVSELAEISHLSRCYFTTVFKNNTGFSPYEYILNYRINMSQQLLDNTMDSIEKISFDCGFSDVSSFIRAFKRQVGLSPLSYRKKKYTINKI